MMKKLSSFYYPTNLTLLLLTFGCSHTVVQNTKQPPESVSSAVAKVRLAPPDQVQAKGSHFVVSTQGKAATQAAKLILNQGGNLIDAAIAASLAISVERPQSTGLGGGGFLIYHEAKTGKNFVLDFRERAPLLSKADQYLDKAGKVIPDLSVTGALSVGVPGLVKGLKIAHQKWGKLPWKKLFAPAIELAEKGFPIYPKLEKALIEEAPNLAKFPASKKIFLNADGKPKILNEILIQKDLEKTLVRLSQNPDDFYTGSISKEIIKELKKNHGNMSAQDLKKYFVKERKPVEADFLGYHIVSMPPPSSGGIHVLQILKLLEHDDLKNLGFQSTQSFHLIAQAMQQAFADRARYLGDPDFVHVPSEGLLSSQYLSNLRAKFNDQHARKQNEVFAGVVPEDGPTHTTHLSLMDEAGNVVVSTQTINGWFGSALVIPGTGIVMNNEMDDFAAKPGASNIFGATATTTANQVAPKQTPLSSMSPTIILKDGKPVLALGAPGGTRIITAVAQTILNYLVYHKDLYTAIASPRIHEQWSPDVLSIENQNVPSSVLQGLQNLGYTLKRTEGESNVMAVAREGDTLIGVSDPRDIGTSVGD